MKHDCVVIAIANQKGDVGKPMISVNLSVCLSLHGKIKSIFLFNFAILSPHIEYHNDSVCSIVYKNKHLYICK